MNCRGDRPPSNGEGWVTFMESCDNSPMEITPQCVVALTWTLKDTLGEVLDELKDPVEFLVGGNDLLPRIEQALQEKAQAQEALLGGKMGACAMHLSRAMHAGTMNQAPYGGTMNQAPDETTTQPPYQSQGQWKPIQKAL